MDFHWFTNCQAGEVIPECASERVIASEFGFRKFTDDIFDIVFWQMNLAFMSLTNGGSNNIAMAMNAYRCMFQILPEQLWKHIAANYWFFTNFGYPKLVTDILDSWYPLICTCKKDILDISALFGST